VLLQNIGENMSQLTMKPILLWSPKTVPKTNTHTKMPQPQTYIPHKYRWKLFKIFLWGYICCTGGDSLWEFQIGLYCTFVRPPPSFPLNTHPIPLKAITRDFFVLFHISIWSPSAICPHLNLLHSPYYLPQIPLYTLTYFIVLSFTINI
jgi:hypothetical protein